LALGGAAQSEEAPRTRIRGTILSLTGETLDVATRGGERVQVHVGPAPRVVALAAGSLADVRPGSYVGTAAVPQPDGKLRALELQVFPESMRGVGEGTRPWDVAPESSMTNGTVGSVAGTSGRDITIAYSGGEKTVAVPEQAPVVVYEPGTPGLLTPGAHVFIMATRAPDGTLASDRVTVGKDGLVPPM